MSVLGHSDASVPHEIMHHLSALHEAWRRDPMRAATIAFVLAIVAWVASGLLGIFLVFRGVAGKEYRGYVGEIAWGPMYIIAFPLAVALVGVLLQVVRRAVISLDRILKPVSGNNIPFSTALLSRFGSKWGGTLLPLTAVLAVLLVFALDFGAIVAPYLHGPLRWAEWRDWATAGAEAHRGVPRTLYFLFNLYAYGLEGLFIYSGLLVLIGVTYPLLVVMNRGLREVAPGAVVPAPRTDGDVDFIRHYAVVWDYTDPAGRCGLRDFDPVFGLMAALIVLTFAVAWVIIHFELLNAQKITAGGAALALGGYVLFGIFLAGVVTPYWKWFPNELPAELRQQNLPTPRPWPFGYAPVAGAVFVAMTGMAAALAPPLWTFVAGIGKGSP